MRELLARLLGVGRRGHRDRAFDEEMQFHVEEAARELERRGFEPDAARRAAECELGGINASDPLTLASVCIAMTAATAERTGTTIDEMRAGVASIVPVRRGGVPADIANTVAFLAAEESGYITGQVIYVDGGRGLL